MSKYEVQSNYGGACFANEDDAKTALWLLGAYHKLEIEPDAVKKALDKEQYYEVFPLSIIKALR